VGLVRKLSDRGFEEVAKRFRTLGDPTRLRILDLLRRKGETPLSAIAEAMDCSIPHASRQLAQLKDASLLARRQEGNTVYYYVAAEWVFELCGVVCGRLEADDEERRKEPLFEDDKRRKRKR